VHVSKWVIEFVPFHVVNAYGGVEICLTATVWHWVKGEWSASRSLLINPSFRKINSAGSVWIGGWVGPRAGLGVFGEKKNFWSLPGFKNWFLGGPASSLVTYRLSCRYSFLSLCVRAFGYRVTGRFWTSWGRRLV
jgi:hypothetical protein